MTELRAPVLVTYYVSKFKLCETNTKKRCSRKSLFVKTHVVDVSKLPSVEVDAEVVML